MIVGMEALIRWHDEELGIMSPETFVVLAEETGLIVPLGEWIIYEACRQNKIWQNKGLIFAPVSVNISGIQIERQNVIELVDNTLRDVKLSAEFLDIELTETSIMSVESSAVQVLSELRERGVSISLDDFGVGYSSLNHLRCFPIDFLKIDRGFIKDIGSDKEDEAIIATIIDLCRTLNISVVAEGVESRQQQDFLLNHKCFLMQGHYFCKAVPAHQFEAMITDGESKISLGI